MVRAAAGHTRRVGCFARPLRLLTRCGSLGLTRLTDIRHQGSAPRKDVRPGRACGKSPGTAVSSLRSSRPRPLSCTGAATRSAGQVARDFDLTVAETAVREWVKQVDRSCHSRWAGLGAAALPDRVGARLSTGLRVVGRPRLWPNVGVADPYVYAAAPSG